MHFLILPVHFSTSTLRILHRQYDLSIIRKPVNCCLISTTGTTAQILKAGDLANCPTKFLEFLHRWCSPINCKTLDILTASPINRHHFALVYARTEVLWERCNLQLNHSDISSVQRSFAPAPSMILIPSHFVNPIFTRFCALLKLVLLRSHATVLLCLSIYSYLCMCSYFLLYGKL